MTTNTPSIDQAAARHDAYVCFSGGGEQGSGVTARTHRPHRSHLRGAGAVEHPLRAPVSRHCDVTERRPAEHAAQHGVQAPGHRRQRREFDVTVTHAA